MTIKDIVNSYYDGTSLSVDDKLEDTREYIFDFDYPVLDEATKKRIEVAILKHYYYREIAFETIGQFKIKLNDRLNLIMGRYNSLYQKQDLSLSPYINSYLKEVGNNSSTKRLPFLSYKCAPSPRTDSEIRKRRSFFLENNVVG